MGSTSPAKWLNVLTTGLQSLKSTKLYEMNQNDDAMLMTLISLQSLLTDWRRQLSNIDSTGSMHTKMTNNPMRILTSGAIWTVMLVDLLRNSVNASIPVKSSQLMKASLSSEWQ
jgi:hypothetical protein